MAANQHHILLELLTEMQRVYPALAATGSGGLSLPLGLDEALARVRALPDNAGLQALARALGHEVDEPPTSDSPPPPE